MQTYWINAQAVFLQKHDFAAYVHQIYQHYQNWCFWQLKTYSHTHVKDEFSDKSTRSHFYGGGKALLFSSDELHAYTSTDLLDRQYQFLQCVKKNQKQSLVLNDGDLLCSVPLNITEEKSCASN